ncbi:hypothetical protein D1872_306220 [compost metagenome]
MSSKQIHQLAIVGSGFLIFSPLLRYGRKRFIELLQSKLLLRLFIVFQTRKGLLYELFIGSVR